MPTPIKKAKRSRRLSSTQKVEACELYMLGTWTIEELATRFNVSRQAMDKMIRREGAVKGSKASISEGAVLSALDRQIQEDAIIHAKRVRETQDESYQISAALTKLIGGAIVKCRTEGRNQSTAFDEYRSLTQAANALVALQKVRERSLGMDKDKPDEDKPLPTLGVQEVTDKQVQEIRNANKVANAFDSALASIDKEMNGKEP